MFSWPTIERTLMSLELRWNNRLHPAPRPVSSDREFTSVQYIGQLGPGGAERQLYNLAVKLRDMGLKVIPLTTNALSGDYGHYSHYLREQNLPNRMAVFHDIGTVVQRLAAYSGANGRWLKYLPPFIALKILALINELMTINPDVLHCWLDYPNIIGGLAGLIAGVPQIILSGRNVNPSHFDWMYYPWFLDWYRVLLKSRRILLINNSRNGAEDYARWLKLPVERIPVIYNGLEFSQFQLATHAAAMDFRKEINCPAGTPLIGGIFRLSTEKRPLDFISVFQRVKRTFRQAKAVVAGIGPVEEEMRRSIEEAQLTNHILLLGRRTDVFTIMKACDVILLTSEHEGTPNVLLEAQYLGVPVVATRAGGTPEIVMDQLTGFLHPSGDIVGMADSIINILEYHEVGKSLGEKGHIHAKNNFSVERMAQKCLTLYESNKS
ncbi:MAG: glycosyltransferase [Deltaproteobacteria bacterium]|nr:glycosyltransferase [Deltaproteobacteria bacterium]